MDSRGSVDRATLSMDALGRLIEWISPWLVEVGSWVFGGLIAVNLVVIAALLTVGPTDRAVRIGVAAFAVALPVDVVGVVLLRLIKDLKDLRLDDLALKAFQQARFPDIESYLPPSGEREASASRRSRLALAYASAIMALSMGLTLLGLAASLWHMAAWIAWLFLASVALGGGVLLAVVVHSQPPGSALERTRRRRHSHARSRKESV